MITSFVVTFIVGTAVGTTIGLWWDDREWKKIIERAGL
jgi:hypothetical protein